VISAILIFLAWGSYLNSLGYRLLFPHTFWQVRSFCPACKNVITWYDNIPVISWILLRAQCRHCSSTISWLYPFIEIVTPTALAALWLSVPQNYFPSYFIFFSTIIVTIRTDFEAMLISRCMTFYLIPFCYGAATLNYLQVSLTESIIGSIFGYTLLWGTKKISSHIAQQETLGQGDIELLAYIGACTGPLGCWVSLLLGSIIGTVVSLIYMTITKKNLTKIPFGPYLGIGTIFFVLFQNQFINYFLAL